MSSRKPASVRLFDWLFWLSQAVMLSDLLLRLSAPTKKQSASGAAFPIISVIIWVLIASAIWYSASIRKSYIALFVIIALVAMKAWTALHIYPFAAWSGPTFILTRLGPLFLLIIASASMMTPSARAWRAYNQQDLSQVFD